MARVRYLILLCHKIQVHSRLETVMKNAILLKLGWKKNQRVDKSCADYWLVARFWSSTFWKKSDILNIFCICDLLNNHHIALKVLIGWKIRKIQAATLWIWISYQNLLITVPLKKSNLMNLVISILEAVNLHSSLPHTNIFYLYF